MMKNALYFFNLKTLFWRRGAMTQELIFELIVTGFFMPVSIYIATVPIKVIANLLKSI